MGISQRLGSFFGASNDEAMVPLLLIHLNIACYALCFWMQRPAIPFLMKELGADGVLYGNFQSALSVMALIGGPLMGRLNDVYGAKFGIIVSQIGSVVMYATTAVAITLPILFFSTFFSTFQHAMQSAQAGVTQLSSTEKRSAALGRLSLSYGVGMVIGSFAGGIISKEWSYYACPALSAFITALVVIANALFLPSLRSTTERTPINKPQASESGFKLGAILEILSTPTVRDVLVVSSLVGLGSGVFQSMFPIMAQEEFGLDSQDLGFFMTFGAVIGVVTNVFVVSATANKLGEFNSVLIAGVGLVFSYAGYSIITEYNQLVALTLVSSMCSYLLYVLLSSFMSKAVEADSSGTAISLSHASRSLTGIVSPLIGGQVYTHSGRQALGSFSASCILLSIVLAFALPTLRKQAAEAGVERKMKKAN